MPIAMSDNGADSPAAAKSTRAAVPLAVAAGGAGKINRSDDAYARLKSEIMNNRLPPGFRAMEQEAALMLGMSRTPVREALVRLQSDGLVRLAARRGFHVLPMSPEDMREIYQLLIMLEPAAAAAVAQRGLTAAGKKTLRGATAKMEQALQAESLDEWAAADDHFHRVLLGLSDNARLIGIVSSLFDQAHRARMITLYLRKKPVQSTTDHKRILNAIIAGDAERTNTLFRAHRERAAAELLAVLERCRLTQL